MSQLVLLIVGAMWMAVLLPPLLRSRFDTGAVSSVSDFRRQLHTLQRSQAPGTQSPMRAMARPLSSSPRLSAPMARPSAQAPRLIASDGVLAAEPLHSVVDLLLTRRHLLHPASICLISSAPVTNESGPPSAANAAA